MGDAFGPLNKGEKLLVGSMAYVSNRIICLKKEQVSVRSWDSKYPARKGRLNGI